VDTTVPATNAITLDNAGVYESPQTGGAALRHPFYEWDSAIASTWSSVLAYVPNVHGSNPWPIEPPRMIFAESVTDLLRAILGDTTATTNVPGLYQFDSVPDAIDRIITHGGVDYYDQIASINWDVFDAMLLPISSVTESYRLTIGGDGGSPDINLQQLITGLLGSHGLVPTWEPDVARRSEVMSLRYVNTVSVTAAHFEGRTVTETEITSPDHREDHSLTPSIQRATVRANYNGEEFAANVPVIDRNAYGITASRGKTLTIEDRLTHWEIGEDAAEQTEAIGALARALVQRVTAPRVQPTPTRSFTVSSRRWFDLGVGRELLVSSRAMSNPYTGKRPLDETPAVIMSTTRDLGAQDATIQTQIAVAARSVYGWAPALDVPPTVGGGQVYSQVIDANTVRIWPWPRRYSAPFGVRTDLSWFACYLYSAQLGQLVPKGCGCGRYSVRAQERHTRSLTVHSDLSIEIVNLAAGSADLVAVGLGAAWDVARHWTIRFSPWDHADLQPCQRLFFCASDADELLIDAAAVITEGHRYG
jgi:hypothetical protein